MEMERRGEQSISWSIVSIAEKTTSAVTNRVKQFGREYKYYSLLNEEECRKTESNSFLHRVYNGSVKSMFLNFIEEENLSREDIEELKSILNERKPKL